jgi:hypothetical protein
VVVALDLDARAGRGKARRVQRPGHRARQAPWHDRLTPVERGVGRLGPGEAVVRARALELLDKQDRAVVAAWQRRRRRLLPFDVVGAQGGDLLRVIGVPGCMPAGGEVTQELLVEKFGRGRGLLIGAHRCLRATSWREHGPGIAIDRPGP